MKLKVALTVVIIALTFPRTVDAFLFRNIFQTLFGWLFCPLFGFLCADSEPCNPNPCMNNGICISTESNDTFQCNCNGTGYIGVTCDEIVDPCNPNPCMNDGVCISTESNDTFQCNCNGTGYIGVTCDEIVDQCNPNPCINGGVCKKSTESNDTFQCSCTGSDYLGVTCSEIPLDVPLINGGMVLQNLNTSTFNANTDVIEIKLSGSEFLLNYTDDIVFLVNNETVSPLLLSITSKLLTANVALTDGKYDIEVHAYDIYSRTLYLSETVWIGPNEVVVTLYASETGNIKKNRVTVSAILTDDLNINTVVSTTNGTAKFKNIPSRTIIFSATGDDGAIGSVGEIGFLDSVKLYMYGFTNVSEIQNNDFSQGLSGWTINGVANASTSVHVENINRRMLQTNNDLVLSTNDFEGESVISRAFKTKKGTCGTKVRYRFVTNEFPEYFGSQYNDYFRVSIRSLIARGVTEERASMNGLGESAFSATGSTQWRELTLPINIETDTVQTDIVVANVGDEYYQSEVIVDFVEEILCSVQPESLSWNDNNGGLDLRYLVSGDQPLSNPVEIKIYAGVDANTPTGNSLFVVSVPAGTKPGKYGPINIPGNELIEATESTMFILAKANDVVKSVKDVYVEFGPTAIKNFVTSRMFDAIKDSLRVAGQASATITSTARTPEQQANAMYNNLVDTGVQKQRDLYASSGDKVIDVYVAEKEKGGSTPATIISAMTDKIYELGPSTVSKHCADFNTICVVDVGASVFNKAAGTRFVNAMVNRVDKYLDERDSNNCFHFELSVS